MVFPIKNLEQSHFFSVKFGHPALTKIVRGKLWYDKYCLRVIVSEQIRKKNRYTYGCVPKKFGPKSRSFFVFVIVHSYYRPAIYVECSFDNPEEHFLIKVRKLFSPSRKKVYFFPKTFFKSKCSSWHVWCSFENSSKTFSFKFRIFFAQRRKKIIDLWFFFICFIQNVPLDMWKSALRPPAKNFFAQSPIRTWKIRELIFGNTIQIFKLFSLKAQKTVNCHFFQKKSLKCSSWVWKHQFSSKIVLT